jgi:hypothetical protein
VNPGRRHERTAGPGNTVSAAPRVPIALDPYALAVLPVPADAIVGYLARGADPRRAKCWRTCFMQQPGTG